MSGPRPVVLFAAATTSYVANVALGTSAATGLVRTHRFRWVHHAVYVSTSVLAGAAASSLLWSPSRAGLRLLPAAVPLAVVPYVSARSRRHPLLALSAAPFFVASLTAALKEQHGVP
ncbi:hypothetical protein SAMN04488544_1332 [Microlunatus sagamiharensis]|uniref:Uncharacterized protein n=1 Tax=Microlunatus sagamiharensis TaxID=546874 RepID=A0A1H2M3C2_9ACTN|nr:hypothetical protein [Microlunatus sagamiharensis]SDU87740.1 hypothetical protein SAMN04488544_1332 [Microlunatus sagamiharensis]